MLKEAIEKIESMSDNTQYMSIKGHDYLIRNGEYTEILPEVHIQDPIGLSSLDAVVEMVRTEAVKRITPVFVSVPTATAVKVFSKPQEELQDARILFYTASATDIPGWGSQEKLPFDQAAVALQTRFQESGDREYCLQLLSTITTGGKVTYNDSGIATTVVTQKGIQLQQNQTIKPLVRLRPYRTFQEVVQPEGMFLIRIDERGITFTEADGGMWKLAARRTVVDYLSTALAPEIENGDVKVML